MAFPFGYKKRLKFCGLLGIYELYEWVRIVLINGLGAVHKLCRLGRGKGGSPKDDLVNRPYLIKKTKRGRG